MQIYLPIAGMSVDVFLLIGIGGITGILAGMFGIGGGFLMTPFLMFIGVPPAVAVSSSTNQIIASSFSGVIAHSKRGNVDFQMGSFLTLGGIIGSLIGIQLFVWLKSIGQIDLVISLTYVFLLGTIGSIMAFESVRIIFHNRKGRVLPTKARRRWFMSNSLPFIVHFKQSNIEVSALLPISIGCVVGILVSIMGVGGGFFTIPALIYLLGMPTSLVIGTSLFQIVFVTSVTTFLYAYRTHTVDIVLSFLSLTTSVVGAQLGTRAGIKLPAEYLRMFLAFIILAIVGYLAYNLIITPDNIFLVTALRKL